ncbi:MAG TPA: CHAT domain-containing protein [Thermoanaerobaculia bacterium]|nr:CHAT domain-containing protein [Thermoanaerobaculia bacterium]
MKLRALALLLVVVACDDRQPAEAPEALLQRGRIAVERGMYEEAAAAASDGMRRYSSDARWNESFAVLSAYVVAQRGDSRSALSLLAATPRSVSAEAGVRRLIALGFAHFSAGDSAAAEASYAQADALAARTMPSLRPEVAMQRTAAAFKQDDYDRAERFAHAAMSGAHERQQWYILANATAMLATIEMNRREWERALAHFEAASRLARSIDARDVVRKIGGNVGWCYLNLGDADAALDRFLTAEDWAERHGITRVQSTWLSNIANVYLLREEPTQALPYAQRAVMAARTVNDPGRVASALTNLATVYIERGDFARAAEVNREAIKLGAKPWPAALNDARITSIIGRPDEALAKLERVIDDSCDPPLRWQAEVATAHLYARSGRTDDAVRMYAAALETGDLARGELYATEFYRFAFETNLRRFYDEYIELLLANGRVEPALNVAERSRARTLREGIGLLRRGEMDDEATSASQLARRTHATILSYWLASERSLLWVATANGVTVHRLPKQAEIERAVDEYARELLQSRRGRESARGRALYDMLVAPAGGATRDRVVVIPHERLTALNFETLITPRSRYWIEDATISYASSLQLIEAVHTRANHDALLIIGAVPDAGPDFPALQRAGDEMQRVSEHFAHPIVLSGTNATPAAYLNSKPAQFGFVHFVAHGTASELSPLDSAVILAQGRLSAADVITSPLDAELVTVSSCNSAGKRAYAGEGLVGLSWAFLRAGAKRVNAALWDVDDRATPKLMDAMYASLARGADPATALREAKLSLLRSGTVYAQPYYWAPFILYGNV